MSKILSGAVSIGALLLAALPLAGYCQKASIPASASKSTTGDVGQSAMRAYRDPETGQLVDHPVTEEQRREAAKPMPAPDMSKLVEIHHPNGTLEVQLNGQFDESVVMRVDAQGNRHIQCTEAGHTHDLDQAKLAPVQEARDDR